MVENIGFQHNAALGPAYGAKHCGIGFITRFQHFNSVAAGKIIKAHRIAQNFHRAELPPESPDPPRSFVVSKCERW
ncbi:Uncharacterised protein [Brucella melitensis]|nr:Uncharacterised protein [Brucella melitensis]